MEIFSPVNQNSKLRPELKRINMFQCTVFVDGVLF